MTIGHLSFYLYVYLGTFRRELITDIKKKTAGDFEKALLAFFQPSAVYHANELDQAMAGIGCNKDVLV